MPGELFDCQLHTDVKGYLHLFSVSASYHQLRRILWFRWGSFSGNWWLFASVEKFAWHCDLILAFYYVISRPLHKLPPFHRIFTYQRSCRGCWGHKRKCTAGPMQPHVTINCSDLVHGIPSKYWVGCSESPPRDLPGLWTVGSCIGRQAQINQCIYGFARSCLRPFDLHSAAMSSLRIAYHWD